MAGDYEPDRNGMKGLLRSGEMQALCMQIAETEWVPRVIARTPVDSGDTAGSTRAEEDRMPDGTAGAKVVQDGASVQNQFGNQRMRAVHHMTDALGHGG